MSFKNGKTKALTFSFDDGNVDDVRLVEVLNRYGLLYPILQFQAPFPSVLQALYQLRLHQPQGNRKGEYSRAHPYQG